MRLARGGGARATRGVYVYVYQLCNTRGVRVVECTEATSTLPDTWPRFGAEKKVLKGHYMSL